MKKRPKLFWFLLATYMPFIGVMMANYLIPVYISDILKANASVYAIEARCTVSERLLQESVFHS